MNAQWHSKLWAGFLVGKRRNGRSGRGPINIPRWSPVEDAASPRARGARLRDERRCDLLVSTPLSTPPPATTALTIPHNVNPVPGTVLCSDCLYPNCCPNRRAAPRAFGLCVNLLFIHLTWDVFQNRVRGVSQITGSAV